MRIRIGLLVAVAFAVCFSMQLRSVAVEADEGGGNPLSGVQLYERRCAICHGLEGKGDGSAARYMDPRPRDFTTGVYKLRSTASGELPTDDDLLRSITRGIPGTAMPAWSGLTLEDRLKLVQTLKNFSDEFTDAEPPELVATGQPRLMTDESVRRGLAVYEKMQFGVCHGPEGRGDGPSARTLKDDQGRPIYPFDFTRSWKMKGGSDPESIYRTFMSGLNGTPMPSYADVMTEDEAGDLVNYCRSLFLDQ